MSNELFGKFKRLVREELEEGRSKRNLKRSEMDDIVKGAITYHGKDDDPLFRASQLYELFRLPDEIMEEERMRGMGYEV